MLSFYENCKEQFSLRSCAQQFSSPMNFLKVNGFYRKLKLSVICLLSLNESLKRQTVNPKSPERLNKQILAEGSITVYFQRIKSLSMHNKSSQLHLQRTVHPPSRTLSSRCYFRPPKTTAETSINYPQMITQSFMLALHKWHSSVKSDNTTWKNKRSFAKGEFITDILYCP